MFKKILKFILIVFIYIAANSLSFSILPFSQDFKVQSMSNGPSSLPFVLISTCWIVFTIIYIFNNAQIKGIKLVISTILVVFMVGTVMTQLETLFFGESFKGILKSDILMIILADLIPIILSVIAGVLLFKRKNNSDNADNNFHTHIDIKKSIITVLIIGLVYVGIYFTFGYFVAWQFEAVRIFYSGTAVSSGFINKLIRNWNDSPIIYPFQYLRGILFACTTIILLLMKWKHKYNFIVSMCLLYLCSAIILIVPNFMFPNEVRFAHLYEMFSSMLLFAVVTSVLLWRCRKESRKTY